MENKENKLEKMRISQKDFELLKKCDPSGKLNKFPYEVLSSLSSEDSSLKYFTSALILAKEYYCLVDNTLKYKEAMGPVEGMGFALLIGEDTSYKYSSEERSVAKKVIRALIKKGRRGI